MGFLRRHAVIILLGTLLVAALALGLVQQRRIAHMETALGTVWANDLSGSFFGELPDLEAALRTWADQGEVPADQAERWWFQVHNMQAVVNNQWNDMTGVMPDLPAKPRHVIGYLEYVRESIPRRAEATGTIPLTSGQREELRRHAQVASAMVDAMKQAYPGWDGGFPSEAGYFSRGFWRSAGWRQALTAMDKLASDGMYPPMAAR